MESGRNSWFKSVVKVQSLSINHNEKFTKPPPLAIGTHENLIQLPWTVTSSLLMVLLINLIDIERRYHHLEGDFCISLWGILRKNLRKRSTYINTKIRLRSYVRSLNLRIIYQLWDTKVKYSTPASCIIFNTSYICLKCRVNRQPLTAFWSTIRLWAMGSFLNFLG